VVNGVSAAVICASALVLSPAKGSATAAPAGGTCCDQAGATCYLDVGGRLIIQSNAYYSAGPCSVTPSPQQPVAE
jgi:hypothetical protein